MRPEKKLGALLAVGIAGAGCSKPPPSQFPSADDALGRMHASYDCAVGVRGTAKVDLVTKKGRVKTSVDLTAVTPSSIRFDVTTPGIFSALYSVTADGKDFKFANHEQNVFYVGPAKQCNLTRFTQVPVPPHALVTLLRGEAPVLVHKAPEADIRWDSGGFYNLTIKSKNEAVEEIHLEVVPEDFAKPWAQQRVRVKRVRVAQGPSDLYIADLSDHRKGKMSKPIVDEEGIDPDVPPSGPVCEAELPYTIRFRVPGTKDDAVWDYQDPAWNPPLLEGTFTQPQPGGMPQQLVDCPGE